MLTNLSFADGQSLLKKTMKCAWNALVIAHVLIQLVTTACTLQQGSSLNNKSTLLYATIPMQRLTLWVICLHFLNVQDKRDNDRAHLKGTIHYSCPMTIISWAENSFLSAFVFNFTRGCEVGTGYTIIQANKLLCEPPSLFLFFSTFFLFHSLLLPSSFQVQPSRRCPHPES